MRAIKRRKNKRRWKETGESQMEERERGGGRGQREKESRRHVPHATCILHSYKTVALDRERSRLKMDW